MNSAEEIRKKWHPAGWMPSGFRQMMDYAIDLERRLAAGTNYVADREDNPTQIKFTNGRRVWINSDGGLDTDFGPLTPPVGDGSSPTSQPS